MDEPTSYLTKIEIESLFRSLKKMVTEGISVLFISHRIDEILSITDRVTVLRAGKVVGRGLTEQLSREDLVSMIVGERDVAKSEGNVEEKPSHGGKRGCVDKRPSYYG